MAIGYSGSSGGSVSNGYSGSSSGSGVSSGSIDSGSSGYSGSIGYSGTSPKCMGSITDSSIVDTGLPDSALHGQFAR